MADGVVCYQHWRDVDEQIVFRVGRVQVSDHVEHDTHDILVYWLDARAEDGQLRHTAADVARASAGHPLFSAVLRQHRGGQSGAQVCGGVARAGGALDHPGRHHGALDAAARAHVRARLLLGGRAHRVWRGARLGRRSRVSRVWLCSHGARLLPLLNQVGHGAKVSCRQAQIPPVRAVATHVAARRTANGTARVFHRIRLHSRLVAHQERGGSRRRRQLGPDLVSRPPRPQRRPRLLSQLYKLYDN
mmetsp:Transcript_4758/g.7655  ORF Transcript_4758/g.7655 Transcript_4758/m.7655 type:complete len:246 (-) Transcript_4758:137-874(-)